MLLHKSSPIRSLLLRRVAIPVVVSALAVAYLAVPATAQGPAGYSVRIENLTSGQPFTPPVLAIHNNETDIFELGQAASEGVRQVAENGNTAPLVATLRDDPNVGALLQGDAPLVAARTPGDATFDPVAEYILPAVAGANRLSWVSMMVCTNDGFTGLDSLALPTTPGQSITVDTTGYETHTEVDTEDFADIVPPCQDLTGISSTDNGTTVSNPALAESGVIAIHDGITGTADLDFDVHGWTDPVGLVTITALSNQDGPPAGYQVQIENLTSGQPFTPPVLALHSTSYGVYALGGRATEGVRAIAENGDTGPLAAALAAAPDVGGHLVAGAPIAAPGTPGADSSPPSTTLDIDAVTGATQLSWLSMLICTNDGFTGLNSVTLPTVIGESATFETVGYETHTEVNTEDFADIVPPCQSLTGVSSDDAGTGSSNPALSEGGVVGIHDGIRGVADLQVSVHGWTDPVARVTITAYGIDGPPLTPAGSGRTTGRLSGSSRIGTAVAISMRQFPNGADVVYLARADNTVDAVAAGVLTDGPILLVPSCDGVPSEVAAEIERLDPTEVFALGGTAAICEATLAAAAG